MNVTFKSIIDNGETTNKFEFTESLTLTEYDGFNVYEFVVTETKVQNRIEISAAAVNIFAGASSINLLLKQLTSVTYETPTGPMMLTAYMSKCDANKENPSWTYTLKANDQLIGKYNLSLKIK